MLKIKDDVPLEELEKFGFRYNGYYDIWEWNRDDENGVLMYKVYITKRHHNIQIQIGDVDLIAHRLQELLYDLIQAGLIEKVSD